MDEEPPREDSTDEVAEPFQVPSTADLMKSFQIPSTADLMKSFQIPSTADLMKSFQIPSTADLFRAVAQIEVYGSIATFVSAEIDDAEAASEERPALVAALVVLLIVGRHSSGSSSWQQNQVSSSLSRWPSGRDSRARLRTPHPNFVVCCCCGRWRRSWRDCFVALPSPRNASYSWQAVLRLGPARQLGGLSEMKPLRVGQVVRTYGAPHLFPDGTIGVVSVVLEVGGFIVTSWHPGGYVDHNVFPLSNCEAVTDDASIAEARQAGLLS